MILTQRVLEIYSSEAVGCGIFASFLNYDNCQPQVVSDVISGMVDRDVGLDVCANFGDSRLKLSAASFSASNVDNFRQEVCSDAISGAFVDMRGLKARVKCGDSRSNRSRDMRLLHFVTNNDNDASRRERRFA